MLITDEFDLKRLRLNQNLKEFLVNFQIFLCKYLVSNIKSDFFEQ